MTTTATTTVTAQDILNRYATDIAHPAEAESPAADLAALAHHLETAASNFEMADINGHEDIDTASQYVNEANQATDPVERDVFLRKADKLLRPIVWDMVQEYRTMVGD